MMSLPEFFYLYCPLFKEFRTMSFTAWTKPGLVCIDPKGTYSNNKHWDQEFFYISGEPRPGKPCI
jgi:hypothetical protein